MCHCLSSGKTECFCHCLGKGQRGAACFWGECRRVRLLGRDIAEGPLSHAAPMITARMPHFAGPVVGAVSRQLSFKQFDNGTVLIGGGTKGRGLRSTGCGPVSRPVCRTICTPDNLPVISPAANTDRGFRAFGYSAHGFQLGPTTGKVMADPVPQL